MAYLPQLIATLAGLDDRPRSFVETLLRKLQSAGLISFSGRGAAAAPMHISDCVNAVIGLHASVSTVDAPQWVLVFRELRRSLDLTPLDYAEAWPEPTRGVCRESIEAIRESPTFGEALGELIAQTPALTCLATEVGLFDDLEITVELSRGRRVLAQITMTLDTEGGHAVILDRRYALGDGPRPPKWSAATPPDRQVASTFTLSTLVAVAGAVLSGHENPGEPPPLAQRGSAAEPAREGEGASGDAPGGEAPEAAR